LKKMGDPICATSTVRQIGAHGRRFGRQLDAPTLRALRSNGQVAWKRHIPDFAQNVMPRLKSSHSRLEAETPDSTRISALPLASRRAEEYAFS
jgi:hypothetical protein